MAVAGSSDIVAAEVAGVRGAGETEFEVPDLLATAKVVDSVVLVIVVGAVELEGVGW